MDTKRIVKEYYNNCVEEEWERIHNQPEFMITIRFLDRYIQPGDKVLDIGGGPGRYSLYLAEKGCDVTLFDLSEENVAFARLKADELNLKLTGICGDACVINDIVEGEFDHILLMGPMYHLLEEPDRVKAVNAALSLLKNNGVIFVSFINMYATMVYLMRENPAAIISDIPDAVEYFKDLFSGRSFKGNAFTKAHFIDQNEILPFMNQFGLEMLHVFGQEGMTSPCRDNIMAQPEEVVNAWLAFCEKTCEREELLSWAEHIMYVGRKVGIA